MAGGAMWRRFGTCIYFNFNSETGQWHSWPIFRTSEIRTYILFTLLGAIYWCFPYCFIIIIARVIVIPVTFQLWGSVWEYFVNGQFLSNTVISKHVSTSLVSYNNPQSSSEGFFWKLFNAGRWLAILVTFRENSVMAQCVRVFCEWSVLIEYSEFETCQHIIREL